MHFFFIDIQEGEKASTKPLHMSIRRLLCLFVHITLLLSLPGAAGFLQAFTTNPASRPSVRQIVRKAHSKHLRTCTSDSHCKPHEQCCEIVKGSLSICCAQSWMTQSSPGKMTDSMSLTSLHVPGGTITLSSWRS